MISGRENAEILYLDDMEDEIIVTEINLRRQNLKLDIKFYLEEREMLAALRERLDSQAALPDLIVTDLNMPGRGGVRLVESLKGDDAYKDVTIGVCTGSENPADHTAALAAGADFVVVKPFDHDKILDICSATGRFELVRRDDGKDHLRPIAISSAAA